MMSADEARRIAKEMESEAVKAEMEEIEAAVNQAIGEGKMHAHIEKAASRAARHKLEQAGYRVHIGSQYNQTYMEIDWSGIAERGL